MGHGCARQREQCVQRAGVGVRSMSGQHAEGRSQEPGLWQVGGGGSVAFTGATLGVGYIGRWLPPGFTLTVYVQEISGKSVPL